MLAVVLVGLGTWAIVWYLGRDVPTFGPSMQPTLSRHDSIDIDTGAYDDVPPAIGDIVALQAPQGLRTEVCAAPVPPSSPCPQAIEGYESLRLIKRVVAGPGDSVAFTREGRLIRNGQVVDEPYILECPGTCALPRAVTIPAGYFFVAGDNRPESSDSRYWGAVPEDAIDGRVELTHG